MTSDLEACMTFMSRHASKKTIDVFKVLADKNSHISAELHFNRELLTKMVDLDSMTDTPEEAVLRQIIEVLTKVKDIYVEEMEKIFAAAEDKAVEKYRASVRKMLTEVMS